MLRSVGVGDIKALLILKLLVAVEGLSASMAAGVTRRSAGSSVPSDALSELGETGWLLVSTRCRVKGLNTDRT